MLYKEFDISGFEVLKFEFNIHALFEYTLRCRDDAVNFLYNPHHRHTMIHAIYLASFDTNVCPASVTEVVFAIPCHIGPR